MNLILGLLAAVLLLVSFKTRPLGWVPDMIRKQKKNIADRRCAKNHHSPEEHLGEECDPRRSFEDYM